MSIGTHDNSLIANPTIIGKTAMEIANTTIIEAEFTNVLSEEITPSQIVGKWVKQDGTKSKLDITTTQKSVVIGHREGGNLFGNTQIVGNKLIVTSTSTQNEIISEYRSIKMNELVTQKKTYTKFVFQ